MILVVVIVCFVSVILLVVTQMQVMTVFVAKYVRKDTMRWKNEWGNKDN